MTAEELLELYAAGERAFTDIDLKGVDLSFQDLSGVNFFDSCLQNVNFSGANLSGAIFQNIDAQSTKLTKAILSNVVFLESDLTNADLTDCFWELTHFSNTTLPDGSFAIDAWMSDNLTEEEL